MREIIRRETINRFIYSCCSLTSDHIESHIFGTAVLCGGAVQSSDWLSFKNCRIEPLELLQIVAITNSSNYKMDANHNIAVCWEDCLCLIKQIRKFILHRGNIVFAF